MLLYLIWKLYQSPFIWGMVPWYAPRGCRVIDQNLEVCCLTPEQLKKHAKIIAICQKKLIFFNQQVAKYLLFQMRYDCMTNSEKQPSVRQRGWGNPCFHITPVLLFSFLFLLELLWGLPTSLHILVHHSATSWSRSGYYTSYERALL